MKKYYAEIDGGEGGGTTFKCESIEEAMTEAIEWARMGYWPDDGGFDIDIRVWAENADGEPFEQKTESIHIDY